MSKKRLEGNFEKQSVSKFRVLHETLNDTEPRVKNARRTRQTLRRKDRDRQTEREGVREWRRRRRPRRFVLVVVVVVFFVVT